MRSELINEIFSVEAEAEKIVTEAQQKGRTLVAEAQKRGELRLQKAIDQARSEKDSKIAQGQQESENRIQSVLQSLNQKTEEEHDVQACAERLADQMVHVLCTSSLGEV
jgi:F0F1-type ATP synthase membrane subunit b/b'